MVGDIAQLRRPDGAAAGEFARVFQHAGQAVEIQRDEGEPVHNSAGNGDGQEAGRRFGMGEIQEHSRGQRHQDADPVAASAPGKQEQDDGHGADRAGDVLVAVKPAPVAHQRRVNLAPGMTRIGDDGDGQEVDQQHRRQHPAQDGEGAFRPDGLDAEHDRDHDNDLQARAAQHDALFGRPQRAGQAPGQEQPHAERHGAQGAKAMALDRGKPHYRGHAQIGNLPEAVAMGRFLDAAILRDQGRRREGVQPHKDQQQQRNIAQRRQQAALDGLRRGVT